MILTPNIDRFTHGKFNFRKMEKPAFELSKLKVMAIRQMDSAFSLMPVGDEFGDEMDLNVLAHRAIGDYSEKRKTLCGKICYPKKHYFDFLEEIKNSDEYRRKAAIRKAELKKQIQEQYKLIWTNPNSGGMYKDYEFVIMDNFTGKLYMGRCDNYRGENWPPVKFYELTATDYLTNK